METAFRIGLWSIVVMDIPGTEIEAARLRQGSALPRFAGASGFQEPAPPADLMNRPHLLARFALGPGQPDVAVKAPAGSGRTSLLHQVARTARQAGIAVFWVDAGARDDRPRGADWRLRLSAASPGLVLIDDADAMAPQDLAVLLDDPRPWRAILSVGPATPTAAPIVLDEGDLQFTPAEAAAYLGPACPDAEAAQRLTRGHPLGLRLIRGLLDRGLPLTPELWATPPVGAELPHWLDTALWPTLPPEVRQFLLAIAPLDAVDGDLAFAVTGGRDAWALLDRLHPLGIPVERIDPMTGRLRLHALIRDYALRCARRAGVDTDAPHRRVAAWLGAQGQFMRAAQAALRGSDRAQARHWVDAEGGWRVVIRGDGGWLAQVCEGMGPAELAALPGLALGLALHLSRMGDPSGARDLIAALPGAARPDDRLVVESVLDGYDDRPFGPEDERRLRGLLARRGESDALLRGAVTNVLAARYLQYGRFHEVTALAEVSALAYETAGARLGAALVRCHAAQAWGFVGEGQRGLAVLDRVATQPAGTGMATEALAAIADVLRAEILLRDGRAEDAAQRLRGALAVVENGDAWHDVLAAAYQTLLRLPPGLRPFGDEAEVIRRGLALAERRGLHRLRMLLAAHAGPEVRANPLAALPPPESWPPDPRRPALAAPARAALGAREAEALRHLADGLTIKEMAVSMGLSENTIKYHVKRLHTRLGVGRRSQLLLAARRLGLLG